MVLVLPSVLFLGLAATLGSAPLAVDAQVCSDAGLTPVAPTGGFPTIVLDVDDDCSALVGSWPKPSAIYWHITEMGMGGNSGSGSGSGGGNSTNSPRNSSSTNNPSNSSSTDSPTGSTGSTSTSTSVNTSSSSNGTSYGSTIISMTPPNVVIPYTSGDELHFRLGTNWTGNGTVGVEIVIGPNQLQKVVLLGHNTTVFVTLGNSSKPSFIDQGTNTNLTVVSTGEVQWTGSGNMSTATFQANIASVAISGMFTKTYVKANTVAGSLSGDSNFLLIQSPHVLMQGAGNAAQLQLNGSQCSDPYWQDRGTSSSCATVPYTVYIPNLPCTVEAGDATLDCNQKSAATTATRRQHPTVLVTAAGATLLSFMSMMWL